MPLQAGTLSQGFAAGFQGGRSGLSERIAGLMNMRQQQQGATSRSMIAAGYQPEGGFQGWEQGGAAGGDIDELINRITSVAGGGMDVDITAGDVKYKVKGKKQFTDVELWDRAKDDAAREFGLGGILGQSLMTDPAQSRKYSELVAQYFQMYKTGQFPVPEGGEGRGGEAGGAPTTPKAAPKPSAGPGFLEGIKTKLRGVGKKSAKDRFTELVRQLGKKPSEQELDRIYDLLRREGYTK